ncbi:aminoadipate-semialdehyde dehydrogenase [Calliopsis andreniformis]|uniref:aminoadipate-semialdehyde dehydrogenase n=1 Tax=Calliopsis andreniformis TaxID=337506 RepID=UPI003FCD81A9
MNNAENNLKCSFNNPTSVMKKLHEICNWNETDNAAIEYHDLQEIIYITYRELLAAKLMLSDLLTFIQNPEFIGIYFDIPIYCVISLILGILTSEHSFVNIPSDKKEYTSLITTLHIRYLFCKEIPNEGDILNRVKIHNESIYLVKLKHIQKQVTQHVKVNYYAYAITTSGSTGTPKVVRVSHSCIVPNILDLNKILVVKKTDRIAQFTNFSFDPSIIEIFLALSNGGTLFMVSKTLKNNANRLLEVVYSSQITILQMTPSVFLYNWTTKCLRNTILSNNTSLRILLLGGEPFPKIELFHEIKHPQNNTKIYNIYGITELSCWASINEIIPTNLQLDTRLLGQALSHTIFQVKDELGNVVANGTGFLHIGSNSRICVINDESIEDFKLPVFRDTGDIVHIDKNSRIFYKGRKNNIIKRFGNKVDLIKLEEFILQLNFVKCCYALWDENCHKLHLCLTTKEKVIDYSNAKDAVTKYLHNLDPLERPNEIHFLKQFECTSSGKVCIKFLKKYIKEQTTKKNVEDDDKVKNIEEIFQCVWRDSLTCETDGFISGGGSSIIALQMSSTLSEKMNIEFPELIGMFLNNARADECLNYIKATVLNYHKERVANNVECHSCNNELIPLIDIAKEHDKYINAECQSSDPFQVPTYKWYKCKGQMFSDTLFTDKKYTLQKNTILKIEILKTYDLEKCVDASPTIFHYSDGNTYGTVGSHSGFIFTFQLVKDSYIPIFRIKLPNRIEASILILDDFKGIVGCHDGNVYCLHLKTGKVIWKYQTGDVVKCSAIACKERKKVFVGSYDFYIYCLSVKDGTNIWKVQISNGSISASGCLHLSSNSVLFGTLDGFCSAVEQSSGKIVWKHKLDNPIFVTPTVLNSGLVLFCSVTGILCCFDIEINVQMWNYKINGNVFSNIVKRNDTLTGCENIIVASQNKNVYCLQSIDSSFKSEPSLKYVLNLHSPIFATPWNEDNILYVACTDGTLYTYNIARNKLTKTVKLPGEVFSSPVVSDHIMVVGCRDNNVYVLKIA